MKLHTSFEIP